MKLNRRVCQETVTIITDPSASIKVKIFGVISNIMSLDH